ncbi:MAG: hypothetical protein Q8S55_14725 [Methylococcaceae bacterium]|nr:hypothetical protein [Methylococcaceae bacterium]
MTHTLKLKKPRYDRFELKVELRESYQPHVDKAVYLITQSIFVNGKNLAPNNPVDWRALVQSCQLSGEFFIVTCGCGNAACAGMDEGIRVSHVDDEIVWEIPNPLSSNYQNMSDSEYEEARKCLKFKKFCFEPNTFLSEVQNGLRIARSYLFGENQPVECSPYGIEPKDLLAFDPIAFSSRGAPIGSHLVGKDIQISMTPVEIVINSISYRLNELPVPDAIKALDNWSDWEPKPCNGGFAYNYCAAPGWELRRRMRLLFKYIASISRVDCVIRADFGRLKSKHGNQWRHQVSLCGLV